MRGRNGSKAVVEDQADGPDLVVLIEEVILWRAIRISKLAPLLAEAILAVVEANARTANGCQALTELGDY